MNPADALTQLRSTTPLVHCMTNYVAMNIAANVCLAAGASPAMVHANEEIEDFTPLAAALTINIGTISAPWAKSMLLAVETAKHKNIPWVFDPVAHFISSYRRGLALELLALKPSIIRGNASEILALAGGQNAGKGADSWDSVVDAKEASIYLANQTGGIVAVTGEKDFVTDGNAFAHISGGSSFMPKVTALGCSLTALMGAYTAVTPSLYCAAQAALAHFKAAGLIAHSKAEGPGSFQVHFLDALATVSVNSLEKCIDG